MGGNPSIFQGPTYPDSAGCPVDSVRWDAAQGFLAATGLRLPTEAEWEDASRAGISTAFHSMPGFPNGANDDALLPNVAWFGVGAGGSSHPVGQKAANGFGLRDMSGNVSELIVDPSWPDPAFQRRAGGGGNDGTTLTLRASRRDAWASSSGNWQIGFRVARTP